MFRYLDYIVTENFSDVRLHLVFKKKKKKKTVGLYLKAYLGLQSKVYEIVHWIF